LARACPLILKAGSTVTVAGKSFKVIGIISQAQGSSPADVHIPLAVNQVIGLGPYGAKLDGRVNNIYVDPNTHAHPKPDANAVSE
jgi:hypothetical protein